MLSVLHPSPGSLLPIESTFNILHPHFGGDLSEQRSRWTRAPVLGTASPARRAMLELSHQSHVVWRPDVRRNRPATAPIRLSVAGFRTTGALGHCWKALYMRPL
jgi:hypothetical protein